MVIAMALTGLCVGLVLDVFFLRNWVGRFYTANLWLVSICYLGLCIVAVAFFMGLPVGTLALGIIACVYIGRRECHAHTDWKEALPTLRKAALTSAGVTTMAALPIGVLALDEQDVLDMLGSLSGLGQVSLQGWAGFTLIGLLCILLFLVQYWFSEKAGSLAYNAGKGNAQQERIDVTE